MIFVYLFFAYALLRTIIKDVRRPKYDPTLGGRLVGRPIDPYNVYSSLDRALTREALAWHEEQERLNRIDPNFNVR